MSAAHEWLKYARDDITTAKVILPEGLFNVVCFHSQQAVEKSLKAFLREFQGKVPYIHILEELCSQCEEIDPSFAQFRDDCKFLDVFYQPTRYPEAPVGGLPKGMPTVE